MSVVSPSQSNAGDEITAAAINNPVNQLAAAINGNIDATNLADSAVSSAKLADNSVTNAKLSTTSGQPGAAWSAHTPVLSATGGALGSASGVTRYVQLGKLVFFKSDITIVSAGTATGAILFTLPVTAQAGAGNIGTGREDAISGKVVSCKLTSTTQASSSNFDNTSPIANGSIVRVNGFYEAA